MARHTQPFCFGPISSERSPEILFQKSPASRVWVSSRRLPMMHRHGYEGAFVRRSKFRVGGIAGRHASSAAARMVRSCGGGMTVIGIDPGRSRAANFVGLSQRTY